MNLPLAVRTSVESVLGASITSVSRVGGGCISPAACVVAGNGDRFFLKWGGGGSGEARAGAWDGAGLFPEEARSLRALQNAGAVRVPHVIGVAEDWLLLEWLEPGRAGQGEWERFGRALAALHCSRGDAFGWESDNGIGSLPQSNPRTEDWAGFWRDARIRPQLDRASGYFNVGDLNAFERHLDALPELLAAGQADGPSLLHGDLWSGNVHIMQSGEIAVIDPSTYYGHREVDLAMAALFGGFPPAFWSAYEEALPLSPGARERRAAYQLYYLLVHVNLFGTGYVSGVRSALNVVA